MRNGIINARDSSQTISIREQTDEKQTRRSVYEYSACQVLFGGPRVVCVKRPWNDLKGAVAMADGQSVVTESRPLLISPKVSEIDFGYHHANDSYIVYPGQASFKDELRSI